MLSDMQIDELIQPIIDIYNQMELELIVEIAGRFKNYDTVSGSLEWQLKKLNELGAFNQSVIKIIAKYSGKSEKQIKEMIEQAGMANLDSEALNEAYNNGVIKVDPVKMMQSPAIRATLEHSYKELNKTYRLIQTKAAEATRKAYIQTLNTAYIDVASGTYDYQTAIKKAVRTMAQKGIEGATYKRGDKYVRYSIEAVVRRDTLTAFHQTANRAAYQSCQEMGSDYVEISQHLGARVHPTNPIANHAGWQGKVFKIEGSTKEYPNLKATTGYPDDIQGLGGVNCRHRMFAFFPGISVPKSIHYDEAENEKAYRLSQKQRKLERDIRALKKQKAAADAIADKEMSELLKYKLNQKYDEINRFCEANGLRRDYSRELVSEQLVKKNVAKSYNNYYNNISGNDYEITDESIASVREIDIPFLNEEQNKVIYNQRVSLLSEMKKYKVGTEGSTIVDLSDLSVSDIRIGGIGATKIDDISNLYYAIHNHPDNTLLSPLDLVGFCKRENMFGLESISNNGKRMSVIVKTINSDSDSYYEYLKNQITEFKKTYKQIDVNKDAKIIDNFCIKLLKEGEQYGFKFKTQF